MTGRAAVEANSRLGNPMRFSSPQNRLLKPVIPRLTGNPVATFVVKRWRQNQPQVAFCGAAVWRRGNGRLTRVCKQTGPVSCRAACAAPSLRKKQSAPLKKRGFVGEGGFKGFPIQFYASAVGRMRIHAAETIHGPAAHKSGLLDRSVFAGLFADSKSP